MDRNVNSHFAYNPTNLEMPRSKFKRPSRLLTTFNAGQLIPLYCDEVLPGDTFQMDTSMVIRMSTPVFPVMDNAYFDYYYFFVPNRLIWKHWKEFNGENNTGPWTQPTEYEIPQIYPPADGWKKGSLADYFGVPTEVGLDNGSLEEDWSISALPFRSYVLVWNSWFRDQNTMSPAYFRDDDSAVNGLNPDFEFDFENGTVVNYNSALYGGTPLPVSKYHDYFTSALPEPQKGADALIPFSAFQDGNGSVPVTTSNFPLDVSGSTSPMYMQPVRGDMPEFDADAPFTYLTGQMLLNQYPKENLPLQRSGFEVVRPASEDFVADGNTAGGLIPNNLEVVLNNELAVTINQLRSAFQIQRLLEKDARGGTRYIEILKSHFGVTSPDGRLQRPEYLGGKRIPINVDQVLQTSATNEVSPQGNTAAFSLTTHVNSDFTQSFTEHGYVICVGCVRTDHTYQQGLERSWFRKKRFDFYWPALANIGEQPIYRGELYLTGMPSIDTGTAFGYQEAWAEYRYKPNRVSGAFRSNVQGSLDAWHYADYFGSSVPDDFVLNSDFISETSANIDRTLAVQSSLEDQFIADFYFDNECTRVMPLYSIPGLIDHN